MHVCVCVHMCTCACIHAYVHVCFAVVPHNTPTLCFSEEALPNTAAIVHQHLAAAYINGMESAFPGENGCDSTLGMSYCRVCPIVVENGCDSTLGMSYGRVCPIVV